MLRGSADTGFGSESAMTMRTDAETLLIGGVAAVMGPVEIYCFYLFSRGGPFYYEGFGVGAFMFSNLACQIAGYYLIAALCLPLGYGHVRLRRWARTLAETLLWAWLVVGVPLTILFLLVLFSAKELSLATGAGAAAVLRQGLHR